ncbi:MAG: SURF1 family protein [Nocardioides sp.]
MPSTAPPRLWAPRLWGVHALAIVLAGATVWLGLWQVHTWQDRRAQAASNLAEADPVPLAQLIGPDDPFPADALAHPVTLTGSWVPGGTVYIADRREPGGNADGYWVVTPLEVGPGDSALLVLRGWTPDPVAAPAPPTGAASLLARLQPPEGRGLTDPDPTDDVLPELRIADAIQHVDQDLYGAYAVPAPDLMERAAATQALPAGLFANTGTDGLVAVPVEPHASVSAGTGLRNLFYALEWWVFGGFVVFVWWRHLADRRVAEAGGPPR